jgi:hypothetical protein
MKNFNIKEWVKTHKPHTAGIITVTVVVTALIVATASGAFAPTKSMADESVKPTTSASSNTNKAKKPTDVDVNVKADDDKEVSDKAETNAKANPNVSETTTEKVEENKTTADTGTKTAKSTTAPSANKSNAGTSKSSGSSSASQSKSSSSSSASRSKSSGSSSASRSKSSGSSTPAGKKWIPEQGHYEDNTEWVPNIVTIVDEPKHTETYDVYRMYWYNTGQWEETTDPNRFEEWTKDKDGGQLYPAYHPYAREEDNPLFIRRNANGSFDQYSDHTIIGPYYKTTPAKTHTEDHGSYQVTGKKWVVDVPGHWE